MYLTIGLVIGVAITVGIATSCHKSSAPWELAVIHGLIFGVMFFVMGYVISSAVGQVIFEKTPERIEFETSTQEIIALKDNKSREEEFFLCTGYEKEEMYYYYAASTSQGIKIEKIKAKNCYVKTISDGETPRIEHNKAVGFKNYSDNIFAIPRGEYTVIYVPEGTITTDFSIDFE